MIMIMIMFVAREDSGTLRMIAARKSVCPLIHAARERATARMTLAVKTTISSTAAPQTVTRRHPPLVDVPR